MAAEQIRDTGPRAAGEPLRRSEAASESANGDAISALRRFHLTGRGAPAALPEGLVPALLHAHRDPERVRDGFPLFVPSAAPGEANTPETSGAVTITDLLRDACARAFATGEGRVVADNLDRLELAVRRDLAAATAPADARGAIEIAGTTMLAALGLAPGPAAEARHAFRALLDHVPAGHLVACTAATPLALTALAKAQAGDVRLREARETLASLADRLSLRLGVDETKRAAGRTSDVVGRSLGTAAGKLIEPDAVASLLGRVRGSVPMPSERRARITRALETIRGFLDSPALSRMTLLTASGVRTCGDDTFDVAVAPDPLAAALERAEASATGVLELCRATRLARLELEDRYDPARHDEWLDALGADMLEDDERALLAPVAVLVDTAAVETQWLQSLSRVLRAPWPIAVVSLSTPLRALDTDPSIDIGYVGMGHRRAFVQQSSISRPVHLYEGLVRALSASRPSLHVIDTGVTSEGTEPSIGRWLRAGAAVEGRAHPLFRFDPARGSDWASRFSLDENPDPEASWPTAEVTVPGEGGTDPSAAAFTFADLALLDPALTGELRLAPTSESDAFLTVDRYLEMSGDARAGHVPCVWAADASGHLHRVAVTERLCRASAERRDFWHTLQELAGVRSTYVERAEARVREDLEADARERLARADAEHADALARARDEAAAEALDGLARFLLDGGGELPAHVPADARPVTEAPAPAAPASDEVVAAEPAALESPEMPDEADDDGGFDDPWIETALCTSCNDCTNINPKLFVYDGNKQAHIGDPDAGTYAELVAAAEKCPARCIHPGKPRNPDEPNLEELLRRAAPFNA